MALDAGLAGLIGVSIGSLLTGGLAYLNTMATNRFQSEQATAQRGHDADEADKQRRHESAEKAAQREHEAAEGRQRHAADLLQPRIALANEWRTRIRDAHDAYEEWQQQDQPVISTCPDLVGAPWFESLRTHFTDSEVAARYRDETNVWPDFHTAQEITQEIGRIERRWIDQALGENTD